ncbi:MAG: hypothetical protein KGJ84_17255, partial [Elusimicrobia bacterium]|nr:hypothetical protein [Elusimicrobiota bacterium]
MIKWMPALLLTAALPARAAVVEGVPALGAVTPGAWVGAAAAPSALSISIPAPAIAAPAPLAAAPALTVVPAAAGPSHPTGEHAASEASRMWDGFGGPRPAGGIPETSEPAVDGLPPSLSESWSRASFVSAVGGLEIAYKHRAGPAGSVPRVYAGGLALNESFDPLFARPGAPARPEYFLWMRGHAPTGWTPTATPIDADARDLARMIVLSARETRSTKVELALHSFGTLIFQRMVQLRAEPEVAQALDLLSGSRVFMLNATTHYEGSEKRAGRQFEQMGTATKQFVGWLDSMDGVADMWRTAAEFNPFLAAGQAAWKFQRDQIVAMASKGAADMMRADLQTPWAPEIDPIRRGFLAALARDSQNHGWQEALLRRSSDMFKLEFTKQDAALVRRMKIGLELIHATEDQLLNWVSAQTLFERLGIAAPDQAPKAGTVLTDKSGLFRATIVAGDHYYPLKQRDDLARR